MDKLTFYAMKSPEKLDRIANYLAERLSQDVRRQRVGFVMIAMEALDSLLVSCHAQSLNLFVESFLKMVQKLLECDEPDLQCLATNSFVKFANIEEDTPSYHRRYDFFVSKFSSMCHNCVADPDVRARLRTAGVRGLQGVVRKTVSDDLQVNIWEKTHMDKIVPSLLYNMQVGMSEELESPKDEDHPAVVAETVFRDLVCRASYGNINSVLKPVLLHLDDHKLWVPNDFAVKCFKIIMYSVQAQYGYIVVQMLMNHLDDHSKQLPRVKASIVNVLSETVLIAAGGSVGPSVLEVFNTLLKHLRISVDKDISATQSPDEKNFQEAIINTIGEFAKNLPDYQKIEVMMFIMGKVPPSSESQPVKNSKDVLLQTMLMKTLLKVATKYKTVLLNNAFPSTFLDPLLRMSVVSDPGIRRLIQEIIHTLLDRHDNLLKLTTVRIPEQISTLKLTVEKAQRQDIMFAKKSGPLFYWHLYKNAEMQNNKVDNFETIFCTLALMFVEMNGDEVLIDSFRFALGIQHMAKVGDLPITHKCAIHAIVAAHLNLISQLTAVPALCEHVAVVIARRKESAPFYLPAMAFNRKNTANSYPEKDVVLESCMFNPDTISDALRNSGHDTSSLVSPFMPQNVIGFDQVDLKKSASDIHSLNISFSLDSRSSSIESIRKSVGEEITFESLKKVLEMNPRAKEEEQKERQKILEKFTNGPFEDIVARSEAKSEKFANKLNEILEKIAQPPQAAEPLSKDGLTVPIHNIQFPELFIY
ncbi:hypothetical protein NP493_315g01029 [Ridgeia piscesae]|uniref:Uncharacterized protein n=1 Tax=Ridgeia piscesae TaxID=27915 RepID=A0AAD9L5K2_RIDPI|nr:hypothetical protein NP493_315g01029 [Ridgeia piscesae]